MKQECHEQYKHNKVKDNIVSDLVDNIYGHNNYLTNSITNSSDLLIKT